MIRRRELAYVSVLLFATCTLSSGGQFDGVTGIDLLVTYDEAVVFDALQISGELRLAPLGNPTVISRDLRSPYHTVILMPDDVAANEVLVRVDALAGDKVVLSGFTRVTPVLKQLTA